MDPTDSDDVNQDAQTQTAESNTVTVYISEAEAAEMINPETGDAETPEAVGETETETQSFLSADDITQAVVTSEGVATGDSNSPTFLLNMVDGTPVLTTDMISTEGGLQLSGQAQGVFGMGEGGMFQGMNLTTATINGQQVIIVTDGSASAGGGEEMVQLTQEQEAVETVEDVTTVKQETVEEVEATEEEQTDEPAAKRIKLLQTEQQEGEAPTYVFAMPTEDGLAEPEMENVVAEAAESIENSITIQPQDVTVLESQESVGEDGTVISQAWFTTRDDKTQLHNKGHSWRMGQWTKEEVELLQQNILEYCQERNVQDPTEIIFEMSKDERKDFYRNIARGLNRPLFSVYRRVIRMYDQRNYIGKYSPGELTKLKELRVKHGSDWATIGAILGRSASSVKDRCRLMRGSCNSGKWLPDEERKLADAVYDLSGAQPGDSITSGLSWSTVSERVVTRTEKQCRTKWLNYLNWKQKGGTEWTREDDILLINKIAGSGATDETQLDWHALAQDWPSARSPQWLRGKWWSLKRHVPHYSLISFTDLVSYIQRMNVSNLHLGPSRSQTVASVKMGQLNLERVSVVAIPMSLAADGTPTNLKMEDGADVGGEISYEVLQNSVSNNRDQGAFLITQPQSNPAISFSQSSVGGSDHIIVHTLPISQVSQGLKQHGHMMVQLDANSMPQAIIHNVPDQGGVDGTVHSIEDVSGEHSAIVNLPEGTGQDLELQTLPESSHIVVSNGEMGQVVLDTQGNIDGGETAAAGTVIIDSSQVVGEDQEQALIAQINSGEISVGVVQGELDEEDVDVSQGVVSSQYVQAAGQEEDLIMSSLSDPMLMSDSTDLAGPYSDIEGDKSQTATEVHMDSPSS